MNWNVLIYQMPKEPQKNRVSTWRKLKSMGAVNILNSIWVMPDKAEYKEALNELSNQIKLNGGSAFTSLMTIDDHKQNSNIIDEFNEERGREYKEILSKCRDFIEEIHMEAEKENFTFVELDENEQELEKIINWVEKVKKKDFFKCELGEKTLNKLKEGQILFEKFTADVYKKDGALL